MCGEKEFWVKQGYKYNLGKIYWVNCLFDEKATTNMNKIQGLDDEHKSTIP